jgi:integrase
MAHIRKLKSGKWQATVRHPSGQRFSKADPLKRVVQQWAADKESDIRRGEFIDPNAGQITLEAWWVKWSAVQPWAAATRDKNGSWWRNHIQPAFGSWPLVSIFSSDIEGWVSGMTGEVGPTTVASSLRLLKQILAAAVTSRPKLLNVNPAAHVSATTPPAHEDRFLTRDEADQLLAKFSGETRLFVEVLLYCGLRWQEAAHLKAFRVDLLRKRLNVVKVRDRRGNEKDPKSKAGGRAVPLTDELVTGLSRLIKAPDESLVFTSPEGEHLRYDNWLARVWHPAVRGSKAEGEELLPDGRPNPKHKHAVPGAGLADPQPTPHDLRHTYGSWLGEDGVPPSQIAALMGHAGLRSVERYIHATDARFDQARKVMGRHTSGTGAAGAVIPSGRQ